MAKSASDSKQKTEILTINQRRWRKFKSLKRGYVSLWILAVSYTLSMFLPLLVSNKALYVNYNGNSYFPAVRDLLDLPVIGALGGSNFISGETLGQQGNAAECNYRQLQKQYEQENAGNTVIMPLYPYSSNEDISSGIGEQAEIVEQFAAPFESKNGSVPRLLGTDDRGRDVFSRLTYGFQISMSFALLVAFLEYLIGIPIGAIMGYFGRGFDLMMQRFMEIWGSLPYLFLIIIIASLITPNFILLVGLVTIFAWMGPAAQMRSQVYREKTRDYVAAAISIGVPTRKILLKHILPNSLVPIITFLPFAIVSGIGALVSLDFLGFGLPPTTASWGEMVGVGLAYVTDGYWWLVLVPLGAMFTTLILVVFIGEGVREAFDPKVFSRLR
ncbi:ABC transporter permease subunit [Ignavibacteria bacterium]|nr:ABC transporter permease subunit [Bacteroidota bacterium]MCZ2133152.1 ABC transporter permease subunit [Bacteroidota bacterium]